MNHIKYYSVIESKCWRQNNYCRWTLYIAWFVAILTIVVGGFFTFAYGVEFGEEMTKKWLGALLVSFFSSILLTQPIKVCIEELAYMDDSNNQFMWSTKLYYHQHRLILISI